MAGQEASAVDLTCDNFDLLLTRFPSLPGCPSLPGELDDLAVMARMGSLLGDPSKAPAVLESSPHSASAAQSNQTQHLHQHLRSRPPPIAQPNTQQQPQRQQQLQQHQLPRQMPSPFSAPGPSYPTSSPCSSARTSVQPFMSPAPPVMVSLNTS